MEVSKLKKTISWILVILWAGLIFSFSNQTGSDSGGLSTRITEFILGIFNLELEAGAFNFCQFLVRKAAHFTEYAVFSVLIFNAVYNTFSLKIKYIALISFLCAALYSISDEFHQLFIADRVGSPVDCIIDSCGALLGTLFCIIIIYFFKKFKNKRT